MINSRRARPAADIALGYAADESGNGIAYAAIDTGSATAVVRLPFHAKPLPALDGLEFGYAATAAVAAYLNVRRFGKVRLRMSDRRVVTDLGGAGAPPKSLTMIYVKARCMLRALGAVRIEFADSVEVRDLDARARAEVRLHVAA